jgi:NADH:ubiquinone oxidoreductase subunit F (NADH-binding)
MADHDRLLGDDPVATLDAHLAAGGGRGLLAALDVAPDEVIRRVEDAGLRGRGGAGFPTGTKWRSVRATAAEAGAPTYVVCNAAEGEPGTFKDRTLLDHDPYAVLEGVLIAMHAVGAQQGFVAVKEKFTGPLARLVAARDELAAAGWRGADRVAVVPGPDEYLFGEEKAMLEVIEGRLAMPRIVPPYQQGLFATTTAPNPTVVNNVETFAHVSRILANGPDWFRELGVGDSPGTMVFTVVGDADNAGVYELPLGTPLRTLLVDIGGANDVKAVFSGTSNAVITPDLFDTPMTFDDLAEAGSGLGSGGFVVYDTSRCIVKVLATLARFLAIESCGQCLACKLGTAEIHGLLDRIDRGEGDRGDLDAVLARSVTVTDANRCFLPRGDQLMVTSTIAAFEDEFAAHLGRPCPDERDLPTPLVESIDPDTGEVAYHPTYDRERPDGSSA